MSAPHLCSSCGLSREKPQPPRIPRGWKRSATRLFCPGCWRKQYLLRAISLPIAAPLDATWKELDADLKQMWTQTTALSNWMMTELYVRDVRRDVQAKLPPMPHTYLYPEARDHFPDLPSQSVASLEQSITAKYRAKRYEILWTRSASLPSHRYPTPFPVHNQSWTVASEDQALVLSVRIAHTRRRLRLKGGAQFRRQRRAIEQIVAGTAIPGECAIYKRGTRTMVKLVAWFPRPAAPGQKTGTLQVRTAQESLLLASSANADKIWTYNGDHLKRWAAEHRRALDRWSEDQKFENRPVPSFQQRRTEAVEKYRRRMDSACHEISACVAGYARRRHFQSVEYNDSEHGFCTEFPFAHLRDLIAQKLDAVGVEFIASAKMATESPEALAEEKDHEES